MDLTRQGVQRILDLLAERTLIEFEENPHHRRAKLVGLTNKGRKTVVAAEQAVEPLNREIIKRVGSRRIREATKTLTEIAAILSGHLKDEDQHATTITSELQE